MPVWTTKFAQNTSDIQGISPIPIIWVIGDKETGKSTFIATVDPVRPGAPSRTLVTDLEMSQETLKTQAPIDTVDIRAMTRERVGKDYTHKDLFVTWRDFVLNIEPGKYTVLGVDPVSDLHTGCFAWVADNASVFGKTPQRYAGEMGTKAQWGDAALYWKQLCLELAQRVETIVFVSHIKDQYNNNVKTGKKEARGGDFKEIATLVLWLDKTADGKRWAMVEKTRLSWWDWGKPEEGRKRPILRDLLPKRLEPQYPGQSYPELIDSYMAAPSADYGDLNVVTHDPTKTEMSDEEKLRIEVEKRQAEMTKLKDQRRQELVNDLIANGVYKTGSEVIKAVQALGVTYTIDTHDEIYKKLVEHANGN